MKSNQLAPLLVAFNLLGRMALAARQAGDIGREFVTKGVQKLLAREVETRRECAAEAEQIKTEVHTAAALFEAAAADGKVTPEEQRRIRAALRKPERNAGHLAEELALPGQ